MKRACLAALTVYVCYLELHSDLRYWLPACGEIGGLGQTVILGVLALIVFGSAILLSYRFLNWMFE
jgi:hypothetical protein